MTDRETLRAALVERAALVCERHMFADHELPLDPELHGKYLDTMSGVIDALGVLDLVEALEGAILHLTEMRGDNRWHPVEDCPVLNRCNATLAKVRP